MPFYTVDRIVTIKDKQLLPESWKDIDLNDIIDNLGNFIVLDIPKKTILLDKRREYYRKSNIESVKWFLYNDEFHYKDFIERDTNLKNELLIFFQGR